MGNYILSSPVLALEKEQWNENYHLKTNSKRSSNYWAITKGFSAPKRIWSRGTNIQVVTLNCCSFYYYFQVEMLILLLGPLYSDR